MANTYTWVIDSIDCLPSFDGKTNVVNTVHWRVNASDGVHIPVTTYGVQNLTYTAGSPFTEYTNLSEATVLGWVQTAMGANQVAAIQSDLDAQIANLLNPPIVSLPLPWTQGTTS